MMKKILVFLFLFIFNIAADAQPVFMPHSSCEKRDYKITHGKLRSCVTTKAAMNDYEPEIFEPSNNLLRRNGKNPIFCGKKIIIKGRVVDNKCVPVSDAKVYLWQVGCDGKYPYKPLRTKVNMSKFNLSKNASTFQGSGVATTNNKGEFTFITIYPTKSDSKSPYINFRVSHRDLGILQIKFFPESAEKDDDGSSYYTEIVMPAKNKHRRY